MKHWIYLLSLWTGLTACQSQTQEKESQVIVGGPCEGCEAILEAEAGNLTAIDTLPDFSKNKPKLKISGTIYQQDGTTPAKDVLLYIYHTNRKGMYPKKGDEQGWAKRHGYLRGWIKTDKSGNYSFYTFRPAAYPGGSEPEHIHFTVKEPERNAYYLDDLVFDDDPMLTMAKREKLKNRGGSGLVQPVLKNGLLSVNRDIILGANIPDYR
jgi:protocatechuate 3,4-dioxygenase, beta subunit